MEHIFYLMNKNKRIAKLKCIDQTVYTDIIYDKSYFESIKNIDSWIESRTTPLDRRNLIYLIKEAGLQDKCTYLEVGKALSMNDTLWINSARKLIDWNKINPYTNSFNKAIAEIALINGYSTGNIKSPSPEYETGGSYDKCWKRINGNIKMIKGGTLKYSDASGNESYSEIMVNQLADYIGIKYITQYNLLENYRTRPDDIGPRVFTSCNLFTNEDIGFLPFEYSKYSNSDIYKTYDIMSNLGRGKEFLQMLLLDSVSFNIDRHMCNYGFLIDNNTGIIKDMAPIFDNNLALIPNISIKVSKAELIDRLKQLRPYTLREGTFIQQGVEVARHDRRIYESLKKLTDFKFDISEMSYMSEERANVLNWLVRNQVKSIISKV